MCFEPTLNDATELQQSIRLSFMSSSSKGMRRASDVRAGERIGQWTLVKEIGRGSFSTVWKATTNNEETSAIKIIPTFEMADKLKECLKREIAILFKVRHPNIVELKDSIETDDTVYIIMELCSGGMLTDWNKTYRSFGEKLAVLKQIVEGLHHLHSIGFVHRDIKPQNILLDPSGCVKIADFGFACEFVQGSMMDTLCGSPMYMAPEILLQKPYDNKVDVWSIGILSYELLTGRPPFTGINCQDLLKNIQCRWQSLPYDKLRKESSYTSSLKSMLNPFPDKRPSCQEILLDLVSDTSSPTGEQCATIFATYDDLIFPLDTNEPKGINSLNNADNEDACNSYVGRTLKDSFVLVTTPSQASFFHISPALMKRQPSLHNSPGLSSLFALGTSPRCVLRSWGQFISGKNTRH